MRRCRVAISVTGGANPDQSSKLCNSGDDWESDHGHGEEDDAPEQEEEAELVEVLDEWENFVDNPPEPSSGCADCLKVQCQILFLP